MLQTAIFKLLPGVKGTSLNFEDDEKILLNLYLPVKENSVIGNNKVVMFRDFWIEENVIVRRDSIVFQPSLVPDTDNINNKGKRPEKTIEDIKNLLNKTVNCFRKVVLDNVN